MRTELNMKSCIVNQDISFLCGIENIDVLGARIDFWKKRGCIQEQN